MVAACVEPLPLCRPRDPQASDLWRLLDQHFQIFQQIYDERFEAQYGFWRPVVARSVTAFLKGGDPHQGFVGQEFIPTRDPVEGLTQAIQLRDV
jgi:hypothetical protein